MRDDVPRLLTGAWSVRRTIEDRILGETGAFNGIARFTPDAAGLRWWEEGTMTFGAHEGPATRELLLREEDGRWVVRFDDGRLFHPLDLDAGRCAVEHPCRADLYTGDFHVVDDDTLDVVWQVRGPRKDLRLASRYRRVA